MDDSGCALWWRRVFCPAKGWIDVRGGQRDRALEFAARVREYYAEREVKRVELRSAGVVPDLAALDSDRLIFTTRPHPNGRDWLVDESRLSHKCWVQKLEHAIGHCAFRGRGHLCEIRVMARTGSVDAVVLTDTRGDNQFAQSASMSACYGAKGVNESETEKDHALHSVC